jgi:DNA-binding CsgD family transcriptional regulator
MFKMTGVRFYPNPAEMDIMNMLSKGLTQANIADKLGVQHSTMRKRFENLRVNLGVNSNEQMMFEFGKQYKKKMLTNITCVLFSLLIFAGGMFSA